MSDKLQLQTNEEALGAPLSTSSLRVSNGASCVILAPSDSVLANAFLISSR